MLKRLEQVILFLFVILVPSQLSYHWWPSWATAGSLPSDFLSPILYLTDILGLILLISTKTIFKPKLEYIIFAVINIYISLSPLVAAYKWLRVIYYLSIYVYLSKKNKSKIITTGLSIALCWTMVLAIFQWLLQRSLGGILWFLGERPLHIGMSGVATSSLPIISKVYLRPYATFPHPNSLSAFIILSCVVLKLKNRLSMFINIFVTVITGSLNSIIAFTVSTLLRKQIKYFIVLSTLSILIFSFIYKSSFLPRIELIKISLSEIFKHPIFGVGLGNFPVATASQQLKALNYVASPQPVHNSLLLLVSELGIPAIIYLIYVSFKKLKNKKSYSQLGVTFILITSMFDHYWLTSHQNILLLTIFFSQWYTCQELSKHK